MINCSANQSIRGGLRNDNVDRDTPASSRKQDDAFESMLAMVGSGFTPQPLPPERAPNPVETDQQRTPAVDASASVQGASGFTPTEAGGPTSSQEVTQTPTTTEVPGEPAPQINFTDPQLVPPSISGGPLPWAQSLLLAAPSTPALQPESRPIAASSELQPVFEIAAPDAAVDPVQTATLPSSGSQPVATSMEPQLRTPDLPATDTNSQILQAQLLGTSVQPLLTPAVSSATLFRTFSSSVADASQSKNMADGGTYIAPTMAEVVPPEAESAEVTTASPDSTNTDADQIRLRLDPGGLSSVFADSLRMDQPMPKPLSLKIFGAEASIKSPNDEQQAVFSQSEGSALPGTGLSTVSPQSKGVFQVSQADAILKQTLTPIVLAAESLAPRETRNINLRLQPADFGQVDIRLSRSANGQLQAHFSADNDIARAALNSGMNDLKQLLQGAGLSIERLEVSSGQSTLTSSGRGSNHNQSDRPANAYGSPADTTTDHPGAPSRVIDNRLLSVRA
jgi:flagellar hook-length control protein FliK